MAYVAKVKNGNDNVPVGHTLYGTCATAANTAAKEVVMPDFSSIVDGVTIKVKFTNSNTAANPTLNVNSTGAKNIYRYGTTAPGATADASWEAGAVLSFTYDGTNWMMNDFQNGGSGSSVSPYTSNPEMDGTASAGSSNDYARGDHVHPSDTSKLGVNDKAASASVADAVEKSLTITSDAYNKTYNGSGAATIGFVRLSNSLNASGWSATTDSQGYYTISQGGARIDGATGRVQLQPGQSQDVIDAYNAIASIDVDGSYGTITAKTKVKPTVNIPIYLIGVQIS